ncbi:MAG: LysM peptidoglycan-binding domain-containing protein [Microscillaceae bacterium]|nr:LysM peptidoglycan-binding domain-containing protein [Microscillaceae bacterium]MDW8461907.1 LysM peptidoglycan-binding domain-containing protein [Cytophagales bacterium]
MQIEFRILGLILTALLLAFQQKSSGNIIERGLGGLIENSATAEQALALHRFLAIGKTFWIRNPANNLETPVKIIGRLPNTGINDKIIIRISQTAYQKLNLKGKKFAIEILKQASTQKITHEVTKGENISIISKKYGISTEKIKKWNDLSTDSLYLGQKLTIYKIIKTD